MPATPPLVIEKGKGFTILVLYHAYPKFFSKKSIKQSAFILNSLPIN